MPSGITAAIYEGETTTLRDYLMTVGRQMGYAILQRDADRGEPVRTAEPNTHYHDERVREARATLSDLASITPEQAAERARADYEKAHTAWCESREKNEALRARYEDMLQQVEEWEPDPLIAGTKVYAIKYLRESIEFDCGRPDEESRWNREPVESTPEQWVEKQRAEALRTLEYNLEGRGKEIQRTTERNAYIEAFLNSLPPVEEGSHVA